MARKYELKRRAERQEQTRQRIVEAAVELHRTKGPARTSLSDIARLAGVQRHTLYRHFPDERSLFMACSGHFTEQNPRPDPSAWREIADPGLRLRRGLDELYAYYERTGDMLTSVLRDAEVHELTREINMLRAADAMKAIRDPLADGLTGPRALAALDLALDFRAWKRLTATGLSRADIVETMVRAVLAQEDRVSI
jgi:AcrR family transcriptional regulator